MNVVNDLIFAENFIFVDFAELLHNDVYSTRLYTIMHSQQDPYLSFNI